MDMGLSGKITIHIFFIESRTLSLGWQIFELPCWILFLCLLFNVLTREITLVSQVSAVKTSFIFYV